MSTWLSRLLGRDAAREAPHGDALRIAEVEAVLESLRPALRTDGGDVRLLGVDDEGWVEIAWRGACQHCFASPTTLQAGIEPALRERCTWFRGIRTR